jgi:hypothetical protein
LDRAEINIDSNSVKNKEISISSLPTWTPHKKILPPLGTLGEINEKKACPFTQD